ncbi:MAG: LysR family transcriptional regulator [Porcincola intestinalis]|uniref:LysR family transcriptional regulator n=1 Tax=Porcincola intestinalis TaxID=2606632 RepID=UPI002A91CEE4|nr:LysR family transcriptional regulator [Porcincola intestinalis]MCI6935207.1 LysR family transcriptional regulator [Clostridiales bacterium]MDY5331978.1 LysR family transcriptional regulator [Porcincola intestinalis]
MNTKQIDYCIELAHTLNFSRAAENMFVSQPTLTYQIKLLEDEVGFAIFERSGKGAALTPAGSQFVTYLANMREEMKRAIEQGQNFSAKYKDNITISMMVRQAVYFLPEAMRIFSDRHPDIQITPKFEYENGVEGFLRNETDILFALKEQTKQIPGIDVHDLFESHIYLISRKEDELASKNLLTEGDLYGRTLMVGGGSPLALKAVQHRLIASGKINFFNSADHDTTLTNVAAGRGVCLAPGFLNDHSGQFAWTPFDCRESFSCVLCTHKNDARDGVNEFIEVLKGLYLEAVAFPL